MFDENNTSTNLARQARTAAFTNGASCLVMDKVCMALYNDGNQYIPTINELKLEFVYAPNHKIFMPDECQGGQVNGNYSQFHNAALNPYNDNLRGEFNIKLQTYKSKLH